MKLMDLSRDMNIGVLEYLIVTIRLGEGESTNTIRRLTGKCYKNIKKYKCRAKLVNLVKHLT